MFFIVLVIKHYTFLKYLMLMLSYTLDLLIGRNQLLIFSPCRLRKQQRYTVNWQEQVAKASSRKSYDMALAFILHSSCLLMLQI